MTRRVVLEGETIIASEMKFTMKAGCMVPSTPPGEAMFYMESQEMGDVVVVNFDTEEKQFWWDDGQPDQE